MSENNKNEEEEKQIKGIPYAPLGRIFKRVGKEKGYENLRISGSGKKVIRIVTEYLVERMAEMAINQLYGDMVTIKPEHIYDAIIMRPTIISLAKKELEDVKNLYENEKLEDIDLDTEDDL